MLIEWTQTNAFSFYQATGGNAGKQVPRQTKVALTLLPGINEVDEATWKKCADHPLAKIHLEEGNIELVDVRRKSGSKKDAPGLTGFEARDAKKIVKQTFDKALLAKWADKESRKEVVTALEKQVELVDKSVPTKTDGE
jgi:hypothetical protein